MRRLVDRPVLLLRSGELLLLRSNMHLDVL